MTRQRKRRTTKQRALSYGRDVYDSQADVWRMLKASGVSAKSASDTAELRRGRPAIRDPRVGRLADC
jgi:hypothetical protein